VRASMKVLIPIVAASLVVAACGGSSKSSSSAAASSQPAAAPSSNSSSGMLVKSAPNSTLGGAVLVNPQGLTLYHLSAEQGGKFICTSATCTHNWPPLTVPSGSKPSGTVGSLGAVKRSDGTEQVTYKGMPLYTFAHDTAPGQANGQGIKDVGTWTAVTTSATKTSASTTPSAPASSSSGGGGYGY
jgi:predicted lipoprotein with Yx(FWY)xxD motif